MAMDSSMPIRNSGEDNGMSSPVPNPIIESLKPTDNIPPPSKCSKKENSFSSMKSNFPEDSIRHKVDGEADTPPRCDKMTLTLAGELAHFVKTNTVSSNEILMAFDLASSGRRRQMGKTASDAVELVPLSLSDIAPAIAYIERMFEPRTS